MNERRIVVFYGGRSQLYCRVTEQKHFVAEGRVLNGAWSFRLNLLSGVLMTSDSEVLASGCQAYDLKPWHTAGHYNDVLEWADNWFKMHPAIRHALDTMLFMKWKTRTFRQKWQRASRAFIKAWRGKDDDICY